MADYLPLPDIEEPPAAGRKSSRVASIDVFRGLCVFVSSIPSLYSTLTATMFFPVVDIAPHFLSAYLWLGGLFFAPTCSRISQSTHCQLLAAGARKPYKPVDRKFVVTSCRKNVDLLSMELFVRSSAFIIFELRV